MSDKAKLIIEAPNGDFCPVRLMQKIMEGEMEIYYFVLPHAEADTVQ